MFFGPIGKTRWPPWPLIGWDIFDFSSETSERNSTTLDRKQDLNVLYQVCVFRADRKKRWPPWPLICWDIFDFSSETAEQNSTKLDREQHLNVLYQVCAFRADQKNKMAALASDWLRHFRLLLWNCCYRKLDRKLDQADQSSQNEYCAAVMRFWVYGILEILQRFVFIKFIRYASLFKHYYLLCGIICLL